jgi:hypothetical protein
VKVIHEPKLKIRGPIVSQAMVESLLPTEYADGDLWPEIVREIADDNRLLIVLDDDPTGCQTVSGVPLCLDYSLDTLRTVLDENPRVLFIVSNSRSLWQSDMVQRITLITENISRVCEEKHRDFLVVSRSDSTEKIPRCRRITPQCRTGVAWRPRTCWLVYESRLFPTP